METKFDEIEGRSNKERDKQKGKAQLTGQVNEVATGKPEEEVKEKTPVFEPTHSPEVVSILATLETYETAMASNVRQTADSIDAQQRRLYYALRAALNLDSGKDFVVVMERIFDFFRENRTGAFSGDLINRRCSFLPLSETQLRSYLGVVDMFGLFCEPAVRASVYRGYNRKLLLSFITDPDKRNRLETYMDNICIG